MAQFELTQKTRPSAWRADLALVFVTFIWGATFVVVKEALNDASTLVFLALRFTLATLALGLVFRPLPSKFARPARLLKGGILAGTFLFAGYAFQTFGLKYTTASKSAFITGLSIVFVPLIAAAVERKVPRPAEWIGIAVATTGMGLMTLQGQSLSISFGDMLTLGCAIAFAVHILVVGHFAPRIGFQALTLTQIATAAALSVATFSWAEPPVLRMSVSVVIAIMVTGLLATALAFSVQAWAQQYTTPIHTALIFSVEPVFAWGTSFLLSGELLSSRATAGAVLILLGILLVELKPFSSRGHPSH